MTNLSPQRNKKVNFKKNASDRRLCHDGSEEKKKKKNNRKRQMTNVAMGATSFISRQFTSAAVSSFAFHRQ